jgi:predicted dehydrogenase
MEGTLKRDDVEQIRVGVLGTGAISQIVYLPILTARYDILVHAVADPDDHKARMIGARFDVPNVFSPDELISHDEVDALFVCTPNHLHEELAVAALEAGKHVLVERPLALTPEGVERVDTVARAAGRCVVVGMSHRFRPDVAALRSFVAGGELGEIFSVRCAWLNRTALGLRSTWRQRAAEAGGGALMDLGVPALDLALWVAGYPKVARVRALTHMGAGDVEDAASVVLALEGGGSLAVDVSWLYFSGSDEHSLRVLGTEGSAKLPPLEVYKQLGGRPMDATPRQPSPQGGENRYMNSHRRSIDQFIRAATGQGEVDSVQDQADLMRLIEAAYRSAREGGEVSL